MVVSFANRENLQSRRLHNRIGNRLEAEVSTVRRRRAEPREAGPYRVVGEVNPRRVLANDEYPETVARIEIGSQLRTSEADEYYWFNWIEPDRSMLVGWHQDERHRNVGPVHIQVNDGTTAVEHEPASFIDSHPLEIVEQRLESLQDAVFAVEWEDGRPVGLDSSASVIG